MSIDLESITDAQLQSAAINPGYIFKGEPLWPYHRSARHLMAMLYTPGHDLIIFEYLALIWILKKRGGATAEDDFLRVLAAVDADRAAVRGKIILWRNDLTNEDEEEAQRIATTMLGLVAASEPILASEPATRKKKERSRPT